MNNIQTNENIFQSSNQTKVKIFIIVDCIVNVILLMNKLLKLLSFIFDRFTYERIFVTLLYIRTDVLNQEDFQDLPNREIDVTLHHQQMYIQLAMC